MSYRQNYSRARKAGLYYVNSFDTGFSRKKRGKSFIYVSSNNRVIRSKTNLKRIKSLMIPPAWQKVWICAKPNGHIQATGFDEKRRKQYIYHSSWSQLSEALKYEKMIAFYSVLARIRARVSSDMNRARLSKPKVIATVIRLIDKSQIRVGSHTYTKENKSRGAVTLTKENIQLDGLKIILDFQGKSDIRQYLTIKDKKVVRAIKHCQQLDAQYLFSYLDEKSNLHSLFSTDINEYLKKYSHSNITAKDFRTWWANLYFVEHYRNLCRDNKHKKPLKKWITQSIKAASIELGNTPSICRNSYIHPGIIEACEVGEIINWFTEINKLTFKSKNHLLLEEQRLNQLLLKLCG